MSGWPSRQFDCVRAFHEKYGAPVGDLAFPALLSYRRQALRENLLHEELNELYDAYHEADLVKVADALTDALYVLIGFFVEIGLDPGPLFDEVHRSNMTKTQGNVGLDGKILKGPGFRPPDIEAVIKRQLATWQGSDNRYFATQSWVPGPES